MHLFFEPLEFFIISLSLVIVALACFAITASVTAAGNGGL
ncbi:hypothetical protein BH10BAC2_BH10BAC2_23750 [soil metagenome]